MCLDYELNLEQIVTGIHLEGDLNFDGIEYI